MSNERTSRALADAAPDAVAALLALDTEAVRALAAPRQRWVAAARPTGRLLIVAARRNALVCVPAAVLAGAYSGGLLRRDSRNVVIQPLA